MNLSELSKELDSAIELKKHNAEIKKKCRQLQTKITKLEKLLVKVKGDLDKVRSDPDRLIDRSDEVKLCQHGIRLTFDSFISGKKVLKVKTVSYTHLTLPSILRV